jgi:predicted nucleic acid-binding Zn ribbon protein
LPKQAPPHYRQRRKGAAEMTLFGNLWDDILLLVAVFFIVGAWGWLDKRHRRLSLAMWGVLGLVILVSIIMIVRGGA